MIGMTAKILVGDNRYILASLEAGSVQTCVTSPPYWGLRDYGQDAQIGLEESPDEYVEQLCLVFDEVWRVLADDGTLWLNLGDSYFKKSLAGIPWRVAFALQERGWYLRSDIIWHKPNVMPESALDRPTKSHEHIFLLTKSQRYFYDNDAIREPVAESSLARAKYAFHSDRPSTKNNALGDKGGIHTDEMGERFVNPEGRNKRDVWTVPTQPYAGAHFAVYPPALITPCILAGAREGDTVLDPFSGSGTTGMVALRNGRNYIGTELNPEYAAISEKRISDDCGMFGTVEVIG